MSDEPRPEPGGPPDPRTTVLVLTVVVEGGLMLLAWVAGWLLGPLPLATFFWEGLAAAWGAAATLPMLALFFACLRWPVGPLRRLAQLTDEVVRPLLGPCTLLDLAGISLLAGLGEEMLFRGVLQAVVGEWTGSAWVALAVASVVFGAAHAVSLTYAVLAAAMGAYLGWLWLATENLLSVVVAHALYDFVALVILLRGPLPPPPLPHEGGEEEGGEGSAQPNRSSTL